MGFWDAVASAWPYANNLHLIPINNHTNISSLIFTGRMLFLMPSKLRQSIEGT